MHQMLCDELAHAGVSITAAQEVENDGLEYDLSEEVVDPGYIDPHDGAFKRPWCPATRILEHRENEQIQRYITHCKSIQSSHGNRASVEGSMLQGARGRTETGHQTCIQGPSATTAD